MSNAQTPVVSTYLSVIERISWWIDPEVGTKGIVYGRITVGAVIAIDGSHFTQTWRLIGTTVFVLIIYFAAHVYADTLARRFVQPGPISAKLVAAVMNAESGIVRGASLPLVAMTVAAVFGCALATVQVVGLAATVLCLILFEVIAGVKARFTRWQLIFQAAVGAGFGIAIIGLRWLSA